MNITKHTQYGLVVNKKDNLFEYKGVNKMNNSSNYEIIEQEGVKRPLVIIQNDYGNKTNLTMLKKDIEELKSDIK